MTPILRWTSESKRTFNQNLEYLSKEWDNSVINNFLDRVESVLEQIKSNPELFPKYKTKANIHKCVVNKRIILFFKIVDEKHIDLVTFWNTYQNPDKLKME